MEKIDFNRDWEHIKADLTTEELNSRELKWQAVTLPHSYNEDDMGPGKTDPYIGPAWYRKIFTCPGFGEDKRIFIEFEGVALSSKVWVDGSYAGGRDGGFLGFRLDITESLDENREKHLIHVLADNAFHPDFPPPLHLDWERYGGIYRPVTLLIGDPFHLEYKGVRVFTPKVTKERALVETKTRVVCKRAEGGRVTVSHALTDPSGKEIATAEGSVDLTYYESAEISLSFPPVESPLLWSTDAPRLYTLKTRLSEENRLLEERTERIGLRYFRFDKDRGFSLNGLPIKLRGCNDHQEFGGLAHACPERYHRFSAGLMKKMGLNFMRTSHYPRSERFLEACDELGIMVMEEQPLWHGSMRSALGEPFLHNSVRLARELAEHHGNHPSIIAWNVGNEVLLGPKWERGSQHAEPTDERRKAWNIPAGEYNYIKRVIARVYRSFKEADPSRPVCHIIGGCWDRNEEALITEIADLTGYNGGTFNRRDYVQGETGKAYPYLMDYLREKHPERLAVMTEGIINDNALIQDRTNRADWEREYKSWEINGDHWNAIYERDWFPGGSMWGFSEYYANGVVRGMGAVDVFRLPLEVYHFYKSQWNPEPMVHILGHWDSPRPKGWDGAVVVFTNAPGAELFLNGKSLGTGRSLKERWPRLPHPPVVFSDVPFEPGRLEAKALGTESAVTDVRETSGEPAGLKLIPIYPDLKADGRDVNFIDVLLVDQEGRRCWTAEARVALEAEGPGMIKGENPLSLRGGLGRFALRSRGDKGVLTITARDEGLEPGRLSLKAI